MEALKTHFTKIYKREPTEEEFAYLVDLCTGMGIDQNDEFLLIFLAIQKMIADGQLGTSEIVKKNADLLKEFEKSACKTGEMKVNEYGEQIKKLFAKGVAEHKRIQGETVQSLVNALNASKQAHTQFLNGLDEKLEKSLMAKVGDVISAASKTATSRANWFFIGTTICIVTVLFFGCFLYSTYMAYNLGKRAGGGGETTPIMALASKYDQNLLEQILQCERPGWTKVEANGRMGCKPDVPEGGAKGWYLPD